MTRILIVAILAILFISCAEDKGTDSFYSPPPPNAAPVFSSSPVTTAQEDVQYSYTVTATDLDGDLLTFSGIIVPVWASFNAGTGAL